MKRLICTAALLACLLGAGKEKTVPVGALCICSATWDVDAGKPIACRPFICRAVTLNVYQRLPAGVLTDNPYGFLSGSWTGKGVWSLNEIFGCTVRTEIDGPEIYCPQLAPVTYLNISAAFAADQVARGAEPYVPSTYRYEMGQRVTVRKVVEGGRIINEAFAGIVCGYTIEFVNGQAILCALVKYAADGYGGIYSTDIDATPSN